MQIDPTPIDRFETSAAVNFRRFFLTDGAVA
jgi:hypothetical protein